MHLIYKTGVPDIQIGSRLAMTSLQKYFTSAVLGVLGYSGHYHAPLFILSSVAPAIHAAAFVAIRGLMQPLMVIIRSLDIVDKSQLQAGHMALRVAIIGQLKIYVLLSCVAITVSLVVAEPLVHIVYDGRYDTYSSLLTGWAVIFAMFAIAFPLETAITRLGKLNQYNIWRLGAGAVGVVTAIILCPVMGAQGAILACIAGWVCCLGIACWLLKDLTCKNPAAFFKGDGESV